MSEVERLSADGVASSPRRGFWVHAGDFNQKINQANQRETDLRQQLADVSNERNGLQVLADEEGLNLKRVKREYRALRIAATEEREASKLRLDASEQAKAEMESTLQYISTSASSRSPSSLRALAKGTLDKVRGMNVQSEPAQASSALKH
jgi:nitrate reductase beta subunit